VSLRFPDGARRDADPARYSIGYEVDFSALPPTDLSAGGTVGGWEAVDFAKASTFELSATDGLNVTVDTNTSAAPPTNNTPRIRQALGDMITMPPGDGSLLIMAHVKSISAAAAALNARLGFLLTSGSNGLWAGPWCQAGPTWTDGGCLAASSSFTDPSPEIALPATSDFLMAAVFRHGVLTSMKSTLWTGAYPRRLSSLNGIAAVQGDVIASGTSAVATPMSASTKLAIGGHRASNNLTFKVLGLAIGVRQ
jgi:hypothetical protein